MRTKNKEQQCGMAKQDGKLLRNIFFNKQSFRFTYYLSALAYYQYYAQAVVASKAFGLVYMAFRVKLYVYQKEWFSLVP